MNSGSLSPGQFPWTTRLYHFLKGPNPLHPNVWNGRLSPIRLRQFEPGDLKACLEIYFLNEAGRFPNGVREDYQASLMEGRSYYLVAERDGRVVASGGVHRLLRENLVVLCFGLVHPEFQGAGIGATMVLSRFALLNPSRMVYAVLIFAVEKSIGYYRRFGFRLFSPWKDKHGNLHPSGHLTISGREVQKCRKLLVDHGVSFPMEAQEIPTLTYEELEGYRDCKNS